MSKQVLGHDSARAGEIKINSNFDENYASIEVLESHAMTADQRAAVAGANSPSEANPFATIADAGSGGGGGSASGSLVGKVATGWIDWAIFSSDNHIEATVAPNTKVTFPSPLNNGVITLAPGTFRFEWAYAEHHYFYCDLGGTLYFGSSVPPGNYSVIAVGDPSNIVKPLIATNHFFLPIAYDGTIYANPEKVNIIDVSDFNVVGDNVTINDGGLAKLARVSNWLSILESVKLFFKDGIYKLGATSANFQPNVTLCGQSKNGTTIRGTSIASAILFSGAQSITFSDAGIGDYVNRPSFMFHDCKFISTSTNTGFYFVYLGQNSPNADYEFVNCDFEFGNIYAGLWLYLAKSVILKQCIFNGNAWHNFRVQFAIAVPLGTIDISNNLVSGGATGLFFGSNRDAPIENVIVENNVLMHQAEECISFDGFGNNAGLCPVICNGQIQSASNDSNGRLVIQANMLYHDGTTPNQPCPVSLRSDWTKYYFSLDEASGREGTISKIYSFDADANSFTLDCYTPAESVNTDGWCGVQAGFFNCVVRNNRIFGAVGASNNYATALSLYLNVFGMIVEGNQISGCAHGINLAGGIMLSTYRSLAYNNIIKNNSFLNCGQVPATSDDEVIRFISYYDTVPQYGNQFTSNTVIGGKIMLIRQQNLIWEGNNIVGVTLSMVHCGNTLPAADASQIGRRFMRITDDVDGHPTAITYYVCKLASGTYSWVED